MTALAHAAETRVVRLITMVFGVATVVYCGLSIALVATESQFVWLYWQIGAAIVVFAIPPLLGVVAYRVSLRTIRRVLGWYALLFVVVLASFVPAMMTEMPLALSPWPILVGGLGSVAAALALPPRLAWLYVIASNVVVAVVRYLASDGADTALALQDAFTGIALESIFVALIITTVASAVALDVATDTAITAAASAAAAIAREREQARLDALVHDEVIATLYYASQGNPKLAASVRRQAIRAVAELARLRAEVGDTQPVPIISFVSRMRSVVQSKSEDISFSVSGSRLAAVPNDVANAFAEATTEAVRNSLTHAGPGALRVSTVTLAADSITVRVTDTGRGFDPLNVPGHRLGLLVSVRGRLAAVPGGSAVVASEPGRGTTVTLRWQEAAP